MKCQLDNLEQGYAISAYEPGIISVRGKPFNSSLIVQPRVPPMAWPITDIGELTSQMVLELAGLKPDLVLFGTGKQQNFLRPALLAPLMERGIGYEMMNTAAACRTYNILMGEERRVLAALIA